jgi:hypothetical protein
MLLAVALVAVAAALVFVAALGHRPLAYVTRDPQATTLERWFLGFFANVGNALWWAAAGVATIAGLALLANEVGRFLVAVAGLTAVLAIDDMFGVHDVWGHQAGIPEWPFFAAYGLLGALVFWRFRRETVRTWLTPLLLAVALYAGSTLIDWLSGHSETDARYLGEDGVKLLAIVCWVAWVGNTALAALRAPTALRATDKAPGGLPYD